MATSTITDWGLREGGPGRGGGNRGQEVPTSSQRTAPPLLGEQTGLQSAPLQRPRPPISINGTLKHVEMQQVLVC